MSSLAMPRQPMDLVEAEILARAGASGRVSEALLREVDHLRRLLDQQDGQLRGLMNEAAGLRAHVAQDATTDTPEEH